MNQIKQRFFDKIELIPFHTCWEWIGAASDNGYGRFQHGTKLKMAHRFSYEIHNGAIPDGLQIDHLCRNVRCVNPSHLEAVTPRENVLRGTGFAAANSKKTHCPRGHAYDEHNTRILDGHRYCRKCMRTDCRRRRARLKVLLGTGVHNSQKTHCKRGHEYSGDNLYVLSGARFCRECKRILARARRALK